jgi:Calcineurin-like phosphoesterase
MAIFDIIPDIHGQIDILTRLLAELGYRQVRSTWRHPNPARSALFLGDFIDRGPHQVPVLELVRRMIDDGSARAVMGNHEFNALCFHAHDPETGSPLRPHSPANMRQHRAFLAELPLGAPQTAEWLDWMSRLPVGLELDHLRIVHACWHDPSMEIARSWIGAEGFTLDTLLEANQKGTPLHGAIDTLLKGPEIDLPSGVAFHDKDGHRRTRSRIAWWQDTARTWAGAVASWPEDQSPPPGDLETAIAAQLAGLSYAGHLRPVFFGHYWLSGALVLQAPNALCLDYSAGRGGPLLAYMFDTETHDPDAGLDLAQVFVCAPD